MPVLDGIEATRRIVGADPACGWSCSPRSPTGTGSSSALDAGAIGYLLKDAEPDELFRGVRAAARGESPLAPEGRDARCCAARRATQRGAR